MKIGFVWACSATSVSKKQSQCRFRSFHGKCDGTFEYFQDQLDLDQQNQAIVKFTQAHVQQRFSDVFAGFRTQALEKPQPKR